jgi:glycyl-tRNA synthetase beta chain
MARLDEEQVQNLAEQTKRIQRIAKDPAPNVEPALLDENEQALFEISNSPCETVRALVASGKFDEAFREILAWMPAIQAYFEEVFVNHEDERIRRNRHALLNAVYDGILAVADLTQIEKKETASE